MTAQTLAAAAVQVIGGVALAPLLPGTIQTWKARLQGRRGPSPLQPYRELRRLWSRSRVTPVPSSAIYELAPLVSAASVLLILLLLPMAFLGFMQARFSHFEFFSQRSNIFLYAGQRSLQCRQFLLSFEYAMQR